MEFQNQALKLDIDFRNTRYLRNTRAVLPEYIKRELKMFDLEDTWDATVKAIVIEGRSKKTDKKDEKAKVGKTDEKNK